MLPEATATRGQKAADWLESKIGWPFIIGMNLFIFGWCILNSFVILGPQSLDPFPWVLLNLLLSFQAAQTGPIVLISGRRQTELKRFMLRQILEIVVGQKTMIAALIDAHGAAKERDAALLKHIERAAARDDRSQKRDEEILKRLAALERALIDDGR